MHIVFFKNDMQYHLTFVVNNIKPADTNLDILYEVSMHYSINGYFPIINDGQMPFYSVLKKWNNEPLLPNILFLADINGMAFKEGTTYTCRPQNQYFLNIKYNIVEDIILTKEKMYTAFTRASVFDSEIKREHLVSALLKSGCFNNVLNTFLTYY
jgi:hypothetical protein